MRISALTKADGHDYSSVMQLLQDASNPTVEACADEVLETVPRVMRVIRGYLRNHRAGLTVPQFRTLWFLSTPPICPDGGAPLGHSLSCVADFIGLSLPAMSRLVDGLVDAELVTRKSCEKDRRHVRLTLTQQGQAAVSEAREMAATHLVEQLTGLSSDERDVVVKAMKVLRETVGA